MKAIAGAKRAAAALLIIQFITHFLGFVLKPISDYNRIVLDGLNPTTGFCNGKKVRMAKGHIKCFKITTADDFELFKAFLAAEPLANITRRDAQ